MGAMGVLSGCVPNVKAYYKDKVNFPQLYMLILAAAGTGKGALDWARSLGDDYDRYLFELSEEAENSYEEALENYEDELREFRKKKRQHRPIAPEKPVYRTLYIPADTSSSMFIERMYHAHGTGVMFETETDTMSKTLKQDWGSYSDMLRKAFHNEDISCSRRSGRKY